MMPEYKVELELVLQMSYAWNHPPLISYMALGPLYQECCEAYLDHGPSSRSHTAIISDLL